MFSILIVVLSHLKQEFYLTFYSTTNCLYRFQKDCCHRLSNSNYILLRWVSLLKYCQNQFASHYYCSRVDISLSYTLTTIQMMICSLCSCLIDSTLFSVVLQAIGLHSYCGQSTTLKKNIVVSEIIAYSLFITFSNPGIMFYYVLINANIVRLCSMWSFTFDH